MREEKEETAVARIDTQGGSTAKLGSGKFNPRINVMFQVLSTPCEVHAGRWEGFSSEQRARTTEFNVIQSTAATAALGGKRGADNYQTERCPQWYEET